MAALHGIDAVSSAVLFTANLTRRRGVIVLFVQNLAVSPDSHVGQGFPAESDFRQLAWR